MLFDFKESVHQFCIHKYTIFLCILMKDTFFLWKAYLERASFYLKLWEYLLTIFSNNLNHLFQDKPFIEIFLLIRCTNNYIYSKLVNNPFKSIQYKILTHYVLKNTYMNFCFLKLVHQRPNIIVSFSGLNWKKKL